MSAGGAIDLSTYLDITGWKCTEQLSTYLDNTDNQHIIFAKGGNIVDLSQLAGTINQNYITDTDGDTRIQVEESADEDIIRFDLAGTEHFVMQGPRLEVKNSGASILIGENAGINDDMNDNTNIAIGSYALYNSIDRTENIAIGDSALFHNGIDATFYYEGSSNIAMGSKTLLSNTTGYENIAIGKHSLLSNTTGRFNTATGDETLRDNTTGTLNTAIGNNTLRSNTTGGSNTGCGAYVLNSNTIGDFNTGIGLRVLTFNTTGEGNTASGALASRSNTTGNYNTANGEYALYQNSTGDNNTATGKDALRSNGASNNTATGMSALHTNLTGTENTANGYKASYSNVNGSFNVAIGSEALYSNTDGGFNTAIGYKALHKNTTASTNTAVGFNALNTSTTGINRTAIGYSANTTFPTFNNNTGLGYNADCNSSNQVRVGNSSVVSIGGYANWSNVSDRRFKKQVSDTDVPGLAFINLLRPVTYNIDVHVIDDWWAENHNERDSFDYPERYEKERIRYTGFIAQEVEAAAQSIGYDFSGVDAPTNDKGFYGLRYATFVVPLVQAVQEVSAQLAESKTDIEKIKMENVQLRREVDILKKQLMK